MKYYDVLDLPPTATAEQIKAAYRILVQLHHPDRLQQSNDSVRQYAEEKLKRINEAYTVLSDPAKRAKYDATQRPAKRQAEPDATEGWYASQADDLWPPATRRGRRQRPTEQAVYEDVYEEWTQRQTAQEAEARAQRTDAERQRRAERERREADDRARRAEAERYPRVREEATGLRLHFAPGQWTTLLRVPAGEFRMGSDPALDPEAPKAELPQHRVAVSEFFIGQYPITNAQYQIFVGANPKQLSAPSEWQLPVGKETHPVVAVSWDDAVAFCQWLTRITGRAFRLPSEAEWEKAARSPEARRYPWGNAFDAGQLNSQSLVGGTTVVGQFSPGGDSVYGVADMSGNVWEWCLDWYAERLYPSRALRVSRDPRGPQAGDGCVVRGGAFDSSPKQTRVTHRNWYYPFNRRANVGFRVVAEL